MTEHWFSIADVAGSRHGGSEDMTIRHVRVTASPVMNGASVELHVDVEFWSQPPLHLVEVYPEDVFRSHFDRLFDRARDEIKRHVERP